MEVNTIYAKPFLKWAGGKSQLIEQIIQYLPDEIGTGQIKKYVEPFVGGGALFFHIAQSYDIEEFMITDINKELILSYKTIKEDVISLIEVLKDMQIKYHRLSENKQKEYYYLVRSVFNEQRIDIDYAKFDQSWVDRTAQIIFLNRTCFNGFYCVYSKYNIYLN
jgi:DNA adenine methylase